MTGPVFHIGFHKTGTSYLQVEIFEKYHDVFYRIRQRDIFDFLIYPDPLEFSSAGSQSFVNEHVEKASLNNQIPVFSNERLSGALHFGGFDSVEIANRIKHCSPQGKIIIGIREQAEMIYSAYSQYVRAIGSYSLKEYLIPPGKKNKTLFHMSYLEYHRLLKLYIDLFGRENVLILPYEFLKSNRIEYLKSVLNFLDIDYLKSTVSEREGIVVNRSLKPSVLSIKKRINPFILQNHMHVGSRFYKNYLSFLYRGMAWIINEMPTKTLDQQIKKKQIKLIREVIGNKYVKSNLETAKITGIDLGSLGYNV